MSSPDALRVIDAIILGATTLRFQKVAMVVAKSLEECEARSMSLTSFELWERLAHLVEEGKLEAIGDISNWRSSEVKLP